MRNRLKLLTTAICAFLSVVLYLPSAQVDASSMYWSTADNIAGTATVAGISCLSSNFCMAVDNSGIAYLFNGSTWTQTTVSAGYIFDSISCPTTSFCIAVGTNASSNGEAFSWSGGSWQAPVSLTALTAPGYIASVSCASTTLCIATDNHGRTSRRLLDTRLHVSCEFLRCQFPSSTPCRRRSTHYQR